MIGFPPEPLMFCSGPPEGRLATGGDCIRGPVYGGWQQSTLWQRRSIPLKFII